MVEEYTFRETVYSHEGECQYDDSALVCTYTNTYVAILLHCQVSRSQYLHVLNKDDTCTYMHYNHHVYLFNQWGTALYCIPVSQTYKIYRVCNVVSN